MGLEHSALFSERTKRRRGCHLLRSSRSRPTVERTPSWTHSGAFEAFTRAIQKSLIPRQARPHVGNRQAGKGGRELSECSSRALALRHVGEPVRAARPELVAAWRQVQAPHARAGVDEPTAEAVGARVDQGDARAALHQLSGENRGGGSLAGAALQRREYDGGHGSSR